ITAGGRVCQPGPNEQSLIVWDKLESLVSGPRHYHDAVRMIVFEWHISQISTIQCPPGDDFVIFDPVDLVQYRRTLIDDGPPLDDHFLSITRRLQRPDLRQSDLPLVHPHHHLSHLRSSVVYPVGGSARLRLRSAPDCTPLATPSPSIRRAQPTHRPPAS